MIELYAETKICGESLLGDRNEFVPFSAQGRFPVDPLQILVFGHGIVKDCSFVSATVMSLRHDRDRCTFFKPGFKEIRRTCFAVSTVRWPCFFAFALNLKHFSRVGRDH